MGLPVSMVVFYLAMLDQCEETGYPEFLDILTPLKIVRILISFDSFAYNTCTPQLHSSLGL